MTGGSVAGLLRRGLPAVWLVVVWVLLWGTFSWANLISGVVVAVAVLALFPLPRTAGSYWVRPLPLLRFVGRFVVDLVSSSVQVAWQSVRPGPPIRSAVVGVALTSSSEFVMAMVVETLSLVPGSVVIEARPEQRTIYAHVLGADDDAAVADFRAMVARMESTLCAALGHPAPTPEVIG